MWSGLYVDFSSTIAVGGTSQQIVPFNSERKSFVVQNPSSATQSLFINFTNPATTAPPSIELQPGQTFIMDLLNFITQEQINVVAATTGHAYTAKEA